MKILATLVWKQQIVVNNVEKTLRRNLDRASIYLVNDIVKSFGNPPPEPDPSGGYKKNSSKSWKRTHHSQPGEPPFVQTGHLRRSITWEKAGTLVRKIGSSLKPQGGLHSYAWYLEMGTTIMAARPYMLPALRRSKATLLNIIARK